jgi:hypothetical protein
MDLLQEALSGRFASVMLKWVMGGGSVRELEPAACLGYASGPDSFLPPVRATYSV